MAQNRRAERQPDQPVNGAPPKRAGEEKSAEQLRGDIDAGRTRDKVDNPDPAAAPLGTDAEAGGAPSSAQNVEAAHRAEFGEAATRDHRRAGPMPARAARPGVIALVTAIVVIAGFAWYFAAL